MTNGEKFKEVFGFYPYLESCLLFITNELCNTQDDCNKCPFNNWWNKEYMECFELKEELDR